METIETLKNKRAELDMKIELLEYAESTFKEGEVFWYVDLYGSTQQHRWEKSAWIDSCFYQGHIFHTEQEAILEAKKRRLMHFFRIFRDKCNDRWKPDWKDFEQDKYYLFYSIVENRIKVDCVTFGDYFYNFGYFKNESDCETAIDIFGDEIKELFVDCEGR